MSEEATNNSETGEEKQEYEVPGNGLDPSAESRTESATQPNDAVTAEAPESAGPQTPNVAPRITPTPIHPNYYFCSAMPPPFTGAQPGQLSPPSEHNIMTGVGSHPYQYKDVSVLSDPTPDTRRNRGGVLEPFPQKLHCMLDQIEREGKSDIVSFFSHGRAFVIHKPKRFEEEVMPRFFKQTRLSSFQRQLNLYGFCRISQGPDHGGYYHELFLKGRPGLCVNMKRTKLKGHEKLKRSTDSEPNFYAYPPVKPHGMVQNPTQVPGEHVAAQSLGGPMSAPIMYPSYPYPPMPFPGYPVMHFTAPYTAAQHSMHGMPAGAPAVYGYRVPATYPGWYPVPTSMPGQMSMASPVQANDATANAVATPAPSGTGVDATGV